MRAYIVLLMALATGAAAEEGGGILQNIRDGFSSAGAAVSSLYTTYETAPYTVDRTVMADDKVTVLYEQRTYPTQKWVCTTEVDGDSNGGSSGAFMKLFAYITGANEGGQKIPMTTPVSMMRVPVSTSQEAQSEFRMCFYINSEKQEDPPAPTSSDVFIENRPTITVLANRDGGYMSENDWEVLAEKLKVDSTAKAETGVDYSKFYRAGYDSPMKFWSRRNEVWYVKQA